MKEGIINNEANRLWNMNRTHFRRSGIIRIKEWIINPHNIYNKFFRLVAYVLLIDVVFVFLYPYLYMLVTSFKSNTDLNDLTVNWIPKTLEFKNYIIAFRALEYNTFIKNSVIYTIAGTMGHLLSCSFIGYGFARYKFPGKNILFILVIVAIIVPFQTLVIPLYMTYSNLKWINTYLPVIVPTFFGFGLRGALFIFIFRQFYLGVPRALEEAARVDGCGFLRIYWNIVIPVVRSAFWVTLVLSTVWHWNDSYESVIFTNKPELLTLPARLQSLIDIVNAPPKGLFEGFRDGDNMINNAILMAGTSLVVIPVLILFAFLQRKFMQGIERTGLTE